MANDERYRPIRTLGDFTGRVVAGQTTESEVLDFKRSVSPEKARDTAKDIVALANAWGGSVLIGVEEIAAGPGLPRTAGSVVGVPKPDELHRWLDQSVRNYIAPGALPFTVDRIVVNGLCVVAVNVPGYDGCAALWDRGQSDWIAYPIRVSFGNRCLTPLEVAERMGHSRTRAVELQLRRLLNTESELLNIVSEVAVPRRETEQEHRRRLESLQRGHGGIPRGEVDRYEIRYDVLTNVPAEFGGFSEDEFQITLTNESRVVNSPYGAVKLAWRQSNRRVALALDMRIMITPEGGGYTYLEPL